MSRRFNIRTRRERRFTRAVALDANGDEVGYSLCNITWSPDSGIQNYDEVEITMLRDALVVRVAIEQDPPSDLFLSLDVNYRLDQNATFTIRA